MGKVLIAIVLVTFILPITAVMADYGDDLKKREARKLEENHKNPTPQQSGATPAPSTESPHGISERSNASEDDQRSTAPSKDTEKNKSSSTNNPKQ